MEPHRALTPSEVADRLQIAKNTVYELIKRGELRGYRVGNQVRVDESDLDAFRNPPRVAPTLVGAASTGTATLVLSGQDVMLDLLARAVEQHPRGCRVLRSAVGSYPGLSGLYLGSVQAAAVHLWNPSTGRYNVDFVRALVPGTPTVTYRLATRTVGWYVAAGNPLAIEGWQALGRSELLLANRERGSGIRVLLDGRLAQLKSPRLHGYDTELPSHLAVAAAVARGEADLGLGNEKTASQVAGVGFVPLQTEEYDLVVRRADLDQAPFQALVEVLRSPEFRKNLEGLGGYGLEGLGQAIDES
jgi:putative molybdopterin biosynthesis protein